MRKSTKRSVIAVAAAALTLAGLTAAQAGQNSASGSTEGTCVSNTGPAALLTIDYANGQLDSGIPDLTTTHATADDASSVVKSGDGHAVVHKVTLGDPAYVSDGAPRSESATNDVHEGKFVVGDKQRYEFSVMLKDWKPFAAGDSEAGDIIFQGKHAGGNLPSFYLMAKRNSIAFRSPTLGLQANVVDDFRSHIGEWMHFRVDVSWTDDTTGYYKVSTKVPGETQYTLRKTYENVRTFHPVNPTTFGYLKWGLYRPDQTLAKGDVPTRVIQHDDIRVLDLSQR
ncbi:polysaccharide lyase [Streptomyces sp. NBC_00424]|uniref:heparin lyase I family protein n=1 Tax=Streptomyces sp. NBC_00424 TaxID=2903648 RepID=UPI0022589DF8|nr:heparin lyase I family protein [Streptomyces sp. NBC_00424]MCX5078523.1 polysaccharide lyase [Streptomyces sp. NBC_00424]